MPYPTGHRGSPTERFWRKVNKAGPINPKTNTTCWLWIAGTNRDNYGRFRADSRVYLAHRYAWELLISPIPDKYVIDHDHPLWGCGNPLCVNPDHLECVSNQINGQRRRRLAANNTSGIRGVSFDARRGRWVAQTNINGRHVHGGSFTTLDAAAEAAEALRRQLHG